MWTSSRLRRRSSTTWSAWRTATAAVSEAQVHLGLGTNLGDRAHNLRAALHALRELIEIDALSPIYESDAMGYTEQPRFWNMAVRGHTRLGPRTLLERVKQLETQLGRTASFRLGPRLIDIDVLLYHDAVIDEPGLQIPHPRMHERAFVLRPLLDIDDTLRHPQSGAPLAQQLVALEPQRLARIGSAPDVLGVPDA